MVLVATYIKKIKHSILRVTAVYLGDETITFFLFFFSILHLNVSCQSICSFVLFLGHDFHTDLTSFLSIYEAGNRIFPSVDSVLWELLCWFCLFTCRAIHRHRCTHDGFVVRYCSVNHFGVCPVLCHAIDLLM